MTKSSTEADETEFTKFRNGLALIDAGDTEKYAFPTLGKMKMLRKAQLEMYFFGHILSMLDAGHIGRAARNRRANEVATHTEILLMAVYSAHLDGRHFNKSAARFYLPLKNNASRDKYIKLAGVDGYITFERDTKDKRQFLLKPTAKLIDYVERRIRLERGTIIYGLLGLASALAKIDAKKSGRKKKTPRRRG